jgi:hypothetical protein
MIGRKKYLKLLMDISRCPMSRPALAAQLFAGSTVNIVHCNPLQYHCGCAHSPGTARIMDHPERDRMDFLLSLQMDSLLDEKTGPELEFLQQLYPTGLMDEQPAVQDPSGDFTYTGDYNALAWATDLNNSPFDNDHQNPASNLNHNGGQNVLASSATLDNPSFRNYYENPRSNLAHHNSDQTTLASSTTLNNPPFNSHHQDSAPTFTHTNYQSNLASASPLINLSPTNQSEHHHPARNTSAIPIPNAAHAHTQRSTSIATPGSPQAGDASGAGAAAIVPRAMPSGPHPPEADGLRSPLLKPHPQLRTSYFVGLSRLSLTMLPRSIRTSATM